VAKTILSVTQSDTNAGTTTAGSTQFWFFGYAPVESNATESTREITWRTAGTLSKLYVRLTANTTSTNGSVTIRKNGADTALSVTVTAGSGAAVIEDASDTVSIAAGDKLCIETVSGGTGTFTFSIISCVFDATTNCSTRWVSKGYGIATASVSHFVPCCGDRSGTTATEANTENTIKTAGTAKNAFINVTANARTTNTTFTLRKNRVDTAITFTYTSGETGIKEDTSNSISYAVDNELDWEITTSTGTQTLTFQCAAIDYETTDKGVLTTGVVGTTSDIVMGEPLTWNFPIGGGMKEAMTTEADAQQKAREAFTFSNLIIYVGTNSWSSAVPFTLRVNGANSALTTSIPFTQTGFFVDTTHTVTVAAGDLVNFQIVSPSMTVSPTATIRQMSVTVTAPSGANIVKTLATETITLSDTGTPIARQTAKIRATATQTISIGETIARLGTKLRPIAAQTITSSENVIRVKGKVKTLATETITITGGTLARLLAKIRAPPAPDTTTISETRQRLGSKSRPLSTQTVALSESSQRIKGAIKALATQTITVGVGTASRLKASLRALAAQTVALTEDLQRTISGAAQNIVRTISQTVVLGESIARLKASQRLTSQTIVIGGGTLTRLMAKIRAVSQTIVIAENVAIETVGQIVRSIVETITISDSIVRRTTKLRVISQTTIITSSVARARGITRIISQTVITGGGTLTRLLAKQRIIIQTITIGGSLVRLAAKLRALSLQTIAFTDSVTGIANAVQANIERLIQEAIIISESITTEVVRASQRFRRIVEPSNRKLKSNHPAYLLATKGQHDDYMEF
jgi:hypothetical protein